MDSLLIAIVCASLTTLITILVHWRPPNLLRKRRNGSNAVTSSFQQLVGAMKAVLHPRGADIPTLLKERADSNQRLVRALGISNTFVSSDPAIHKEFVGQAQVLLNGAKRRGWTHVQNIACEAVRWQLLSSHSDQASADYLEIPLDSFIQNVTLVVVLVGVLHINRAIESFSHHDVGIVARKITALWALSKKQEPIPPIHLSTLRECLHRLVEEDNDDSQHEERFSNPLNFVVPAWETLWRVVATTVAYSYNNEEICVVLGAFNECPSDEAFRGVGGGDPTCEITAKGVVNEAMRLHPPSKHIARARKQAWCPSFLYSWFGMAISSLRTKHHADVERLLRCHDVWGADAVDFRPSRQNPSAIATVQAREQEEALSFVFGHGPLRCIAASWAPMAAAVISGVVIEQLQAEGYKLEVGEAMGGRDGWMGWSLKKTLC